jgi:hypothetical protein
VLKRQSSLPVFASNARTDPWRCAVVVAEPFETSRADDDRVADDERRRVQADFALSRSILLVLADDHALLQVDDAVLAEGGDG